MSCRVTFVVALIVCTSHLSGCASAPQAPDAAAALPAAAPQHSAATTPAERRIGTRRLAGAGQAAVLYARSVHVERVVRPVSFVATGASLVVKSAGGVFDRLALSAIHTPALEGPVPSVGSASPMDLAEFEAKLDRITGTRRQTGTIEFLVDGDAYFERLESTIDAATESIDIRTYIFDNDDFAVRVADRLKARAADDIRVRVMVDPLGNMQALQVDPDTLPQDHRPPLSMTNYLRRDSDVRVRSIANPWTVGEHTKTTIIDGRVAFVGGMNIGREYRYEWHDLMMEVRGPIVNSLQFESDKAWARSGPFGDFANLLVFLRGERTTAVGDGYPIRILKTRNFDSDIYRAQLAAIRSARRYILIQNAYFSDDRTLYELARARRRGVDVRVIVPERGNHGPLNASNAVAIGEMLAHGIRVYRYPGMSHVKAAVFDGWACVGSANFDKLSLQVNKELNLATSEPAAVLALLRQVFIPDLAASEELLEAPEVGLSARIAEVLVDELL